MFTVFLCYCKEYIIFVLDVVRVGDVFDEARQGGEEEEEEEKDIQGNTRERKQQQTLGSLRRLFDITTLH